jgi:eukaryotic-like serine/threonine-protein kinase
MSPHTLSNGRYELDALVGSGHFGEVWRGRDAHQDTEIAVKLLEAGVALDEVLLESQLLARFRDHPRIVTIRNVEVSPPRPFIVMDFMSGGSLQDRLESGDVSIVEAVRWVRHALDGLAHAHGLGVLHRDIKPGNILLDDQVSGVLSDFGIAEDTVRNLLANDAIYVAHAAPELMSTGSTVLTDIWAMGCTLYRLLTGEYAFTDDDDARVRPLVSPHRLDPQIPMSLTRVIEKALAKDPPERYQDARRMLANLTNCRIINSWRAVPNADYAERWECESNSGRYECTVRQRRDHRFEVVARLDQGRGLRRVFRDVVERESDALRVRRNVLTAVVQGNRP